MTPEHDQPPASTSSRGGRALHLWKTHWPTIWKVTKTTGIILGVAGTGLGIFVDFRETTEILDHGSMQANVRDVSSKPPQPAAVADAPVCGNGVVEESEDCDNGTGLAGALCTRDCTSNLVHIQGGSMLRGFSERELDGGLHLRAPSRKSAETLRNFAMYATPATPIHYEKFWLMRTEVPWSAMNAFLQDDGPMLDPIPSIRGKKNWSRFPGDRPQASVQWHLSAMEHARSRYKGNLTEPELPARVDLTSAVAFCAWLGGYIPTEDQWEAAARGNDGNRTFPWGERPPRSSPEDCDLMTGFFHISIDPPIDFNCGGRETSPVGSHPAGCTPEGVCDMAGNADEFVTPGAVVWQEKRSTTPGEEIDIVAGLPGPRESALGEIEFLRSCSSLSSVDPYGMVSGQVHDCVKFIGGIRDPVDVPKSYPADRVRAILRGGNFDDSLPVLYQSRGRYPFGDPTTSKGFRCVL